MIALDERIDLTDKPNDLLAIGELLVDMISDEYGDSHANDAYTKYAGGSPANIAINVHRLGIRSRIASAVGHDGLGTFLVQRLREAGMDTGLIQRTDDPTSLVVVTKSRDTPIPIFYRGADHQLAFDDALGQAVRDAKIVHFSCWPLSNIPARDTMERVIAEARGCGSFIGFDPNYHRMIWRRGEDGVAYVKSIIPHVDIVKPSEDDAARLFGPDTHENQIEKFLELGAKFVMMTLGKDGVIVSNGYETMAFPSMASEVTDTTGAGDAFWSGFYTALVKGFTVKEAVTHGLAVSAYKLKFTGAVVDLPTLEVVAERAGLREEEGS